MVGRELIILSQAPMRPLCLFRHLHSALLFIGIAMLPAKLTAESRQPNFLFLYSDDQRADTLAALGNDQIQTPNLDRLVGEGTAFRRAYIMGGLQGAVCVPSRAMMMSGRSLFRVNEQLRDTT